jgi:hypothetical protein
MLNLLVAGFSISAYLLLYFFSFIPIIFSRSSVGKKQLFWFFQRWLMYRQKTKCAVYAVGFLSSNVQF